MSRDPLRQTAARSRAPHLGFTLVLACTVALLAVSPAVAADCPDDDGDDYAVCGGCDLPSGKTCGDCDDDNAAINPGALEKCDGIDNDCDGLADLADPDLAFYYDDIDIPVDPEGTGVDDDGDGKIDEGFDFCVFKVDGPGTYPPPVNVCLTGGRLECNGGAGTVVGPNGGTLECQNINDKVISYSPESLADGNSCFDGVNNDCDCDSNNVGCDGPDDVALTDVNDPDCQEPEKCDGIDNDGDGLIDEDFGTGALCSVGLGECEREGVVACDSLTTTVCSASPGNPKNEGVNYGFSCDNGDDDDCDGFADGADPDCAGFGADELCGNGLDDDNDGLIDEEVFPQIGQPCATGVGACRDIGALVCNFGFDGGIGDGVICDAEALEPPETEESTCDDFVDNDCDGFTDARDADCAATFADLGVTCSLPYTHAKPGGDCTGKHTIEFGSEQGEVTADLLALDVDGSLLAIIEDVQPGDTAHLASRLNPDAWHHSTKTNKRGTRHTVFYPIPLLRVTGTNGSVDDVAYCSIMPYLEVTDPDGLTISLSESNTLEVASYLPLVDVDTLGILFDGIDILSEVGIDPATDFPTNGSMLCTSGCVFQIEAGCGDGSLVDVELRNLMVEGLDTDLAMTAKDGVEVMHQVNTLSFDLVGLPAGGHIVYIAGMPLPLRDPLTEQCNIDDLADAGTASAFGITIDSPAHLEKVASAPVNVDGTACGGNEIAALSINGHAVDVSIPFNQECTTGNGMTTADECVVDFNEPIQETDILLARQGSAPLGTFKRGSNRIIADAIDVKGNRTFNTDTIFGLGPLQSPTTFTVSESSELREAWHSMVAETASSVTTTIDPAFVVGLEESAVQDFFNAKCEDAINQFTDAVSARLNNKDFGSVDIKPDCSCNLSVPLRLPEDGITFTPSSADPTCAVDFRENEIGVVVNLPDVRVKIVAKDSCTDHGIFGECIARTKVDVEAVIRIEDISFEYAITETQIETKTLVGEDAFTFNFTVKDEDGTPLIASAGNCTGGEDAGEVCLGPNQCEPPPPAPGTAGVCSDGPDKDASCTDDVQCRPGDLGAKCKGGDKDGRACKVDGDCTGGGTCHANCAGYCDGVVTNGKDQGFEFITKQDSDIECWGAWVCNVFDVIGRAIGKFFAEVFTLGYADTSGFLQIVSFDVNFEEDFLAELSADNPDAMELDEVEIDEGKVNAFGHAAFTPGSIDVEIKEGGLTVAFGADFTFQSDDPEIDETPPPPDTPAPVPTVAEVIAAGDEISIMIADDVFTQVFAGMKEAGLLQAFCTDLDGKTVNDLLPAVADGGCDLLGVDPPLSLPNVAIVTIQGICHAIRGADCETLTASSNFLTDTKQGVCHGATGPPPACSDIPVAGPLRGVTEKGACNITPEVNVEANDGLLLCARLDMEPDFTFSDDDALDNTVDTELLLNDLSVVFALDRGSPPDGYTGTLEALPGCFGAEGSEAPDCRLFAACLDLTLNSTMGIDNSSCSADETGFVFAVSSVTPSGVQPGVVCNAGTAGNDELVTAEGADSIVVDEIKAKSDVFMPPQCVEGLTLGNVLDFTTEGSKLFAITTSGRTEHADYLGLTGGLGVPTP